MNKGDFTKISRLSYEVSWLNYEEDLDINDSNIDVHVKFINGPRYVATFFTIKNIEAIFQKNFATGECSNGLYLWASNMIIVKQLKKETITKTIDQLIIDEEFELIFDGPYYD